MQRGKTSRKYLYTLLRDLLYTLVRTSCLLFREFYYRSGNRHCNYSADDFEVFAS